GHPRNSPVRRPAERLHCTAETPRAHRVRTLNPPRPPPAPFGTPPAPRRTPCGPRPARRGGSSDPVARHAGENRSEIEREGTPGAVAPQHAVREDVPADEREEPLACQVGPEGADDELGVAPSLPARVDEDVVLLAVDVI